MSGRSLDDDELRRAFEAQAESSGECTQEDLDRVWLAVGGELPPADRRDLVERMAADPALAEAWRIAHELQRGLPTAIAAESRRASWWSASWLAAAAVLLLAVTVVLVMRRDQSGDDTLREPGRYTIESLVTPDAVLPRDAFRLSWRAGPPDARYQVRVTTEDLRMLATAADLSQPEFVLDPALLAGVPPGSRVFWQVEVTLPNGERETSPTFAVRAQ